MIFKVIIYVAVLLKVIIYVTVCLSTLTECPEFKWGQNCTDPCNCVKNNTEYCDSTTGLCVCNKAWKSRDCSVDVDECLDDPLACPDFSDCHNLHGSYQCTCKAGLVNTSTGCARKHMYCMSLVVTILKDGRKRWNWQ